MGSNAERRSRKRRDTRYDQDPNDEVVVAAGPLVKGSMRYKGDKPELKSITRASAFYDARDAMKAISDIARDPNSIDTSIAINPSVLVDPPKTPSVSHDLNRLWNEIEMPRASARDITTLGGMRDAAAALNLPAIPKSRRKHKQQKARGRERGIGAEWAG
jgi:hypothetical protein